MHAPGAGAVTAARRIVQNRGSKAKDIEASTECSLALRSRPHVASPRSVPGRSRTVRRHRHATLRQRAVVPVMHRGRSGVPILSRSATHLAAHGHAGHLGGLRRSVPPARHASFAAQIVAMARTGHVARLDHNPHRSRGGSIRRVHESVLPSGSWIQRHVAEPDWRPRRLYAVERSPTGGPAHTAQTLIGGGGPA